MMSFAAHAARMGTKANSQTDGGTFTREHSLHHDRSVVTWRVWLSRLCSDETRAILENNSDPHFMTHLLGA